MKRRSSIKYWTKCAERSVGRIGRKASNKQTHTYILVHTHKHTHSICLSIYPKKEGIFQKSFDFYLWSFIASWKSLRAEAKHTKTTQAEEARGKSSFNISDFSQLFQFKINICTYVCTHLYTCSPTCAHALCVRDETKTNNTLQPCMDGEAW